MSAHRFRLPTIRSSAAQLLTALAAVALSACASDPFLGSAPASGVNYAAGSALADQLTKRDLAALYPVFLTAMEKAADGEPQRWSSATVQGEVTPGAHKVGNLREDPNELIAFRPGLFLSHRYETALGQYVMTRNGNVRFGPSTETQVAQTLRSGDGVDVVGKVVGAPWMLVAVNDQIIGFVYESLLTPRPGRDLTLAGGPTRKPFLCREFYQTMSIGARADRWGGAACDHGGGWRLVGPTPNAPARLF